VSEQAKPSAFDPRRLADLASRFAPGPASVAVPEPSAPAASPQQPSAPAASPQQPSMPAASPQQSGLDARPDEVGPMADAGETVGLTGHPQVDTVLAELERAEQLPPDQQIPVYESVHRTLQETLRSIEQS
jgi:hypothetical protein